MNDELAFLFQEYNDTYHKEILLNNDFNNFVRNYELAYWGPNTAFNQIGSPVKPPLEKNCMLRYQCGCIILNVACLDYSEFDDDDMEKKGDEWLPLGTSFQNHVKLYVRYNIWLITF